MIALFWLSDIKNDKVLEENIIAHKSFLKDLNFESFRIPDYQRPYCWSRKNVQVLLDCILNSLNKTEYRIGSIILNPEKDYMNLVDGQQRLTTLSLLTMALGLDEKYRLQNAVYVHRVSKERIYDNYQYIKYWINNKLPDTNTDLKERFKQFLLDKCSVNEIRVLKVSEAFQMFDSQNGRGKALEGHNLLKAYHLRAIDSSSDEEFEVNDDKIQIDQKWEKIVAQKRDDTNMMAYLLNHLYRIRTWSNTGQPAFNFTKKDVDEFKGIHVQDNSVMMPFQNIGLLLFMSGKAQYGNARERYDGEGKTAGSFMNIDMQIVNGRLFFTYIETYYKLYNRLFDSNNTNLKQFYVDFKKYCEDYAKSNRTGDTYIKSVYISLLLFVFDKFGEEGVKLAYKRLYAMVYRVRLENKQVKFVTMAKFPMKIFAIISKSRDIENIDYSEIESSDLYCKYLCPEILKFFVDNRVELGYNIEADGDLDSDREQDFNDIMKGGE